MPKSRYRRMSRSLDAHLKGMRKVAARSRKNQATPKMQMYLQLAAPKMRKEAKTKTCRRALGLRLVKEPEKMPLSHK